MLSIFPAFVEDETCRRISQMLRSAGLPLGEAHSAGAAAIRAVRRSDGGLLLCQSRLRDMTALQVAEALGETGLVVVLQRAPFLPEAEGGRLLWLPLPPSPRELTDRLRCLLEEEEQRQRARHRNRSPAEEETILQAKSLLAVRLGVDEQAAHRLLQRLSMQEGLRLAAAARRIIDLEEEEGLAPDV